MVLCHLIALSVFSYYLFPIVHLHVAFVSKNELASEWKRDLYYVVLDINGKPIWVREVDVTI